MRQLIVAAVTIGSTMSLMTSTRAVAQMIGNLEALVMPGPVIDDHAQWEQDCSSCHARLSRTTQDELCLACHEEIAFDVSNSEGFHGRRDVGASTECRGCHTEHVGRSADIVQLDQDTFDHDLADFALMGAHGAAQCDGCHMPDLQHREAPSECIDCHAEDDSHAGGLGEVCADCHTETAWLEAVFHHDETNFPLVGGHNDADCDSCHASQQYESMPMDCYSCHRLNDVHQGARGALCESCHTPHDWPTVTFDHDRDTDFSLLGQHSENACAACHLENPYEVALASTCISCHADDDEHRGRNGEECANCHTPATWAQVEFDHTEETDFPLNNRHAEILCDACHRGPVFEVALEATCFSCHRADDSHDAQMGEDCGRCHNDGGWASEVLFDHDLTRFPLAGLHATVPCEECHLSPAFQGTARVCAECHQDDDVHAESLGNQCETCHTPNDWAVWTFNHDTQTDFPLAGAHQDLTCGGCHLDPVQGPIQDTLALETTCASCHQGDDVHLGRFGRNCQRCHSAESFEQLATP